MGLLAGIVLDTKLKESKIMSYYKYNEIKKYFLNFILMQSDEWIRENYDDLHHHAFNTDYYIIGYDKATKWLGDQVFNCINIIKVYEQDHFGQVTTDLTNPEKVVNMYAYIVGELVVFEWLSLRLKFTKAVND